MADSLRLRKYPQPQRQNSQKQDAESAGIGAFALAAQVSREPTDLNPAVIIALGTGMRMGEQLQMKRHQADFLRNIVTARNTKNGRPRDIPMNDDVREALVELCRDKRPDEYVFVSPKKKESCLRESKRGFHTACRVAEIEGLIWKDLRATFGTRLARDRMRRLHNRPTLRALRRSCDHALRKDS